MKSARGRREPKPNLLRHQQRRWRQLLAGDRAPRRFVPGRGPGRARRHRSRQAPPVTEAPPRSGGGREGGLALSFSLAPWRQRRGAASTIRFVCAVLQGPQRLSGLSEAQIRPPRSGRADTAGRPRDILQRKRGHSEAERRDLETAASSAAAGRNVTPLVSPQWTRISQRASRRLRVEKNTTLMWSQTAPAGRSRGALLPTPARRRRRSGPPRAAPRRATHPAPPRPAGRTPCRTGHRAL